MDQGGEGMRVIVDCGATKSDWCFRTADGVLRHCYTEGMNFAHMPPPVLQEVARKAAGMLGSGVEEIYVFAAGIVDLPSPVLEPVFPQARIEYASDLVAAARAVCGHAPGIAAILGTGSNSCLFDGSAIVRQIPGGGYILGDEGSAAALGRRFVSDYIKKLVPDAVASAFAEKFPADYASLVQRVYRESAPARFLGSIAPFLLERYEDPYVEALVDENFRAFFSRMVLRYGEDLPVGVVGGFGYACRPILRRLSAEAGVRLQTFLPSPMDGLAEYYGI